MPTLVQTLLQHPLFVTLDRPTLESLARAHLARTLAKGEFLAHYGDVWPYLFFVRGGEIQAMKISTEGRNLVVGTFQAGELFWGPALFHPEVPLPFLLEANIASRVSLWSRSDLLPVILENGGFAWELSRLLVSQMLRASSMVEGLAFQPVAGRVANLLLETCPNEQHSLARSLTLEEMAARTGTTREMVCRVLQRFANEGVIEITRTEFTLLDREKLAQLAG